MNDLAESLLRATVAPPQAESDATTEAIVDAALRQFELFGVARSTMDQIAKRAGIARVTVYRRFPGKDALIDAVMVRELQRFMHDLEAALEPFPDVEERLVEGFVFVMDAIRSHRLLQRVLESEPETILPNLTVHGSPFLTASRLALLARLPAEPGDDRTPEELAVVADVVVRLLLSFLLTPSTVTDLDDPEAARTFVRRYLRPILLGVPGH